MTWSSSAALACDSHDFSDLMWGVKTSQHLNQMRIIVSKQHQSKTLTTRKPTVPVQLLCKSLTVQLREKQPSHQFCGIILFFNPNSSTDSSFHKVQLQRYTSTLSLRGVALTFLNNNPSLLSSAGGFLCQDIHALVQPANCCPEKRLLPFPPTSPHGCAHCHHRAVLWWGD